MKLARMWIAEEMRRSSQLEQLLHPRLSQRSAKPNKRTGLEERLKLHEVIRKSLNANPDLHGTEFCAELDKRHAPPLHDWVKRKEWREGLHQKDGWKTLA